MQFCNYDRSEARSCELSEHGVSIHASSTTNGSSQAATSSPFAMRAVSLASSGLEPRRIPCEACPFVVQVSGGRSGWRS